VSRSLQRHLSKMLAVAVLACGVIATAVAFYFAYAEAQEFQDDALRQIAALSAGGASDIRQLDAASKSVEDPESRIRVVRLPAGPRPAWLPPDIAPGLHTLAGSGGQEAMRVFVRDTGHGGRLAVAQSTDSRNEIALNSALRTQQRAAYADPAVAAAAAADRADRIHRAWRIRAHPAACRGTRQAIGRTPDVAAPA